MKNTVETLEQIRAKNGNCSDYRLAKLMGLRPNYISLMMHKGNKMTEAHRIKAAELLNEDPEVHLIYRSIERAKKSEIKHVWQHTLERLTDTAAESVYYVK